MLFLRRFAGAHILTGVVWKALESEFCKARISGHDAGN